MNGDSLIYNLYYFVIFPILFGIAFIDTMLRLSYDQSKFELPLFCEGNCNDSK